MNRLAKNQDGFTLVEIIISTGMIGLVGMALMTLQSHQLQITKNIYTTSYIGILTTQIQKALSDEATCGINFSATFPPTSSIPTRVPLIPIPHPIQPIQFLAANLPVAGDPTHVPDPILIQNGIYPKKESGALSPSQWANAWQPSSVPFFKIDRAHLLANAYTDTKGNAHGPVIGAIGQVAPGTPSGGLTGLLEIAKFEIQYFSGGLPPDATTYGEIFANIYIELYKDPILGTPGARLLNSITSRIVLVRFVVDQTGTVVTCHT